jgi:hypothetical protein
MKKRIFASFLAAFTLFFCGLIPASAATPGEIQAEEQRMKALITSLDADKITKITIEQMTPNGMVIQESSAKEAVQAWVNLFQRMELTGVAFEYGAGGNGTVYIHDERGKVRIGCLEGGCITNGGVETMCRIDNYAELSPEIESALQMVIGAPWWVSLPSWMRWALRYICFGWIWMAQ